MLFCVDFSFCTNFHLTSNRFCILNVVSYLIRSYSTFVSYFKYFVFNCSSLLNVVSYLIMSFYVISRILNFVSCSIVYFL